MAWIFCSIAVLLGFFISHLLFTLYESVTATILLEPHGDGGTRYTAIAQHANPDTKQQHAEMGFEHGWGTVLTQLVAYVKGW